MVVSIDVRVSEQRMEAQRGTKREACYGMKVVIEIYKTTINSAKAGTRKKSMRQISPRVFPTLVLKEAVCAVSAVRTSRCCVVVCVSLSWVMIR